MVPNWKFVWTNDLFSSLLAKKAEHDILGPRSQSKLDSGLEPGIFGIGQVLDGFLVQMLGDFWTGEVVWLTSFWLEIYWMKQSGIVWLNLSGHSDSWFRFFGWGCLIICFNGKKLLSFIFFSLTDAKLTRVLETSRSSSRQKCIWSSRTGNVLGLSLKARANQIAHKK